MYGETLSAIRIVEADLLQKIGPDADNMKRSGYFTSDIFSVAVNVPAWNLAKYTPLATFAPLPFKPSHCTRYVPGEYCC